MGGDHGDHIHYEEVALDEMEWVEEDGMYYYQCPCGDMFEISQEDIEKGEDVARCPSCSLTLKVILPAAGKDAVTTTPAQTTAIAAGQNEIKIAGGEYRWARRVTHECVMHV